MRFPFRTSDDRTNVQHLSETLQLFSAGDDGTHVDAIGDDAWLVQTGAATTGRRRVTVDTLDERTWVLRGAKGPRRQIQQVGPELLRTHLLVNNRAARSFPRKLQRSLADYACQQQTAWVLRSLGINCLLDVGANVGQFATSMRDAGYTGRIVSFEPLSHCQEELRKAAADDPDWEVMDCALGAEDGTAEINARPGTMSSLLPTSDYGRNWSERLRESKPETIAVRRLDGLCDEVTKGIDSPRVFLKMDTQGFDLQVFAGAGGVLRDILGLQSELSYLPIYDGMPRMQEALTVYEDAGFEVAGLYPVSFDHDSARVVEFDVVMVRSTPDDE